MKLRNPLFSIQARCVVALLSGAIAAGLFSPAARADMIVVQNNYDDYGHALNVGGPGCASAAIANSFRYLENRYPLIYDNRLTDGMAETARDRLLENPPYIGCPPPSQQAVWEGKVRYVNDFAPGTTVFSGQQSPFGGAAMFDTSGWLMGNRIQNVNPTFEFVFGELKRGEDVEIAFFRDQLSHMVTLTSLKFDDTNNNMMWEPNAETAMIDYLDPNNPSQLFETTLFIMDGVLAFDWSNGGANDPVAGVMIFQAFAESPVPEPGTIVLLGIGSVGLVGFGWRRRKPAA